MITVYTPQAAGLRKGGPEVLGNDALWIDLLAPTSEEEQAVEAQLGINIPTREEMQEIEVSSRLSREHDILYMTSPVLTNSTGFNPQNIALTFILTPQQLITVRYATPQALANTMIKLDRQRHPLDGSPGPKAGDILLDLLEALVDRLADVLERIALELDGISHRIFHQPNPSPRRRRSASRELEVMIRTIGRGGDLQSKARDTILGMRRVVSFLPPGDALGQDAHTRTKTIGRDLQSLSEYADFLNSKIGFLLDATLGMINIQQNHIIKLFSVMAVLLMPPTLVASIYGMNFHHMPELEEPWGYPLALALMFLVAIVPYRLFKRKGWL